MAKYPYIVNKNGVWYPAGADVPEDIDNKQNKKDFAQYMNPPVKSDLREVQEEYTKTDINRMSTAELRQLAKEKGMQNAGDKTGTELKRLLIDMMCL